MQEPVLSATGRLKGKDVIRRNRNGSAHDMQPFQKSALFDSILNTLTHSFIHEPGILTLPTAFLFRFTWKKGDWVACILHAGALSLAS